MGIRKTRDKFLKICNARDPSKISLLVLSKFKRINDLLFLLWFSDDFRENLDRKMIHSWLSNQRHNNKNNSQ